MSTEEQSAYLNKIYDHERKMYHSCMMELKSRLFYIKELVGKGTSKEMMLFNTANICLQYRSCIELIVLSSLAIHKKFYKKNCQKVHNMYQLDRITTFLDSQINKNYYPAPVNIEHEKDGEQTIVKCTPKETGFLTKEDIKAIYDTCHKYIHPRNPFKPDNDYEKVWGEFSGWYSKITNLLHHHIVNMFDLKGYGFL